MKKIVTIFAILLFGAGIMNVQAQTEDRPTWMSLHLGHNEYDGDLGNEMLGYELNTDWSAGLGFHQYLSPSFDFDAIVEYGYLDYKNQEDPNPFKAHNSFGTSYLNTNLMVRYKLANGYIFRQNSTFQPFIAAGIGVTPFFNGDKNIYKGNEGRQEINSRVTLGVPLSAGFDIRLSDRTKLTLKATYNRTFVDGPDDIGAEKFPGDRGDIDGKTHDDFLVTSVGFKFGLGGPKDSDGDGIPDKEDQCPEEAGSKATQGCPDTDRDGVADSDDRCPTTAGLEKFGGCPDSDEDGVPDTDDECPDTPGDAEHNGCPDSDDDGVIDPDDRCPDVAGDPATGGCPDSDGDGIADGQDKCPEVEGLKRLQGCPDSDGDGIADAMDKCPNRPGSESNSGCPEIKEDVNFAFDSAKLEEQFKQELVKVSQLMKENEELTLLLEGHADRIGPAQYNLRLSKRRAEAAKQYVVEQGVESSRINTKGYGENRPQVKNANAEERRKNRRVEIKVN